MSKLNKVITAFQQDFTSVEKAQARANIGAVAKEYYNADVLSHNISSADEKNGYFDIEYQSSSQQFNGLMLFNIEMTVGASYDIVNAVNPVVLRIKLKDSNNVDHTDTVNTGVLCRTNGNQDWRYVGTFFFDFSRVSEYQFVSMKIEVDTGPNVIHQNTDVIISIQRDMVY